MKNIFIFILFLLFPSVVFAYDPYDPFDTSTPEKSDESDENKTPDELLLEASKLLTDERPLDARTKLLTVLKKDPKNIKAYTLLGGYYLSYVGHFRLALRYIEKAQALFIEESGKPPYTDIFTRSQDAQLLNLLSQTKLNLDDYEGSLALLDEFERREYMSAWYPGSRAWVLMKLGRLQDAIKIARAGVLAGFEPGRSLNMLGILLSMNKEPQDAITMLESATDIEESMGSDGNPATPLNNMGEVYEEIFKEDAAERSYLRALSKKDGCDNVLPSLNLAFLYVDMLNLKAAKTTIDNFESCVAQYPLRNGEEHKAFIHLARGRIDLLTGHIDSAIEHFNSALEKRQWFGKIGTDIEDLRVGALISLSQALRARLNWISSSSQSVLTRLSNAPILLQTWVKIYYIEREARRMLVEDLKQFEDIRIRNTDAMIEYPTLGNLLSTFPKDVTRSLLARIESDDPRPEGKTYYSLYKLHSGILENENDFSPLLSQVISHIRPGKDELLSVDALLLKAKTSLDESTCTRIFLKQRSALRNAGLTLPVNVSGIDISLSGSPFRESTRKNSAFNLLASKKGEEFIVEFISSNPTIPNAQASASDLYEALSKLSDQIFSEKL